MQVSALLALPSAIWISEWQRNEPLAIGVFLGSILVFAIGYILARAAKS